MTTANQPPQSLPFSVGETAPFRYKRTQEVTPYTLSRRRGFWRLIVDTNNNVCGLIQLSGYTSRSGTTWTPDWNGSLPPGHRYEDYKSDRQDHMGYMVLMLNGKLEGVYTPNQLSAWMADRGFVWID